MTSRYNTGGHRDCFYITGQCLEDILDKVSFFYAMNPDDYIDGMLVTNWVHTPSDPLDDYTEVHDIRIYSASEAQEDCDRYNEMYHNDLID